MNQFQLRDLKIFSPNFKRMDTNEWDGFRFLDGLAQLHSVSHQKRERERERERERGGNCLFQSFHYGK